MKTLIAAAFIFATSIASAGIISSTSIGLWNTGVDASSNKVTTNGTAELHWAADGDPAYIYKHPAYFTDSAANWISEFANGGSEGSIASPAQTAFELSFDLTGYDPSQTTIAGIWGLDNFGSILLNGSSSGNTLPAGSVASNFNQTHNFSLTSGFIAGINTIRVVGENEGGPGAMFMKFTDIQSMSMAVPEPSGLIGALTMASLGVLFIRRRR